MSALARAYNITEIESDESLVAHATKECHSCDPDSPLAVKRDVCTVCQGAGREPLLCLEIARELAESRLNLVKGSQFDDIGDDGGDAGDEEYDEELFLEY